jgi:dynamin 1-like protein
MHHIRNTLPEIKAKIGQTLLKYQQELMQIGDPLGADVGNNVCAFEVTCLHADSPH